MKKVSKNVLLLLTVLSLTCVVCGQGYPLRWHWLPWGLGGQELVRWLFFGEGSLPVIDQEVVLWVSDTQSLPRG